MLPVIAGVVGVFAVGAYLYNEASSSNESARRDYDDACDNAQNKLKRTMKQAQKKDALDKLVKAKKAKRKIAGTFSKELEKVKHDFKELNNTIKESKDKLSEFFTQKRLTDVQSEKQALQEEINLLQDTRKELFATKDLLEKNLKALKKSLSLVNNEITMIQKEIDKLEAT